ncbi:MAG: prepilin-type N-terminal cleavage/methylation domain-containing protein [Pseudohongiellaceae bacterium]|jgi:prepilin-type N-terminal cleavage/methylation domain-containing protein
MATKPRLLGRCERGFTLVEVLAATALFAVLGGMLFSMVRGSMEVAARGERVRTMEEHGWAVLDLMAEDLRHAWCGVGPSGEQRARFFVDPRTLSDEAHGVLAAHSTVLRFSRLLYEYRALPWLRLGGEHPGAELAASLTGYENPEELLPTGGLAESLYGCVLLPDGQLPVLMRQLRSPLGGADSLLAAELVDPDGRLSGGGVRLVDGVLHFAVRCWAPDTTAWAVPLGAEGASALAVWDSTRGVRAVGDAAFPYGRGPDSLLDGHDDLFPPAVRLELVLAPPSDNDVAPASLTQELSADETRLRLPSGLANSEDRSPNFLWIDGEWLGVLSQEGDMVTVKRGQRGTLAVSHSRGAAMRVGQLFEQVVFLPTARENFDP